LDRGHGVFDDSNRLQDIAQIGAEAQELHEPRLRAVQVALVLGGPAENVVDQEAAHHVVRWEEMVRFKGELDSRRGTAGKIVEQGA
jgi:hypothetical protein